MSVKREYTCVEHWTASGLTDEINQMAAEGYDVVQYERVAHDDEDRPGKLSFSYSALMVRTTQTVVESSDSDADTRVAELESQVSYLQEEMMALRWAIDVTDGLADLSIHFQNRLRDSNYQF